MILHAQQLHAFLVVIKKLTGIRLGPENLDYIIIMYTNTKTLSTSSNVYSNICNNILASFNLPIVFIVN